MRRAGLRGAPRLGVIRSLTAHPKDFGDFYLAYYPRVLRYFACETRDPQLSLELAAETFAKAFEARESFRGTTSKEAVGWLWEIARNELEQYRRRRRVEISALRRLDIATPKASEDELQEIHDRAALDNNSGELYDAFATLTENEQTVIEMRVLDERSYQEIAADLGVTEDAVRKRLSKGLRRLARNATIRRVRRATG